MGEGHFATLDDVPPQAITVTIPALLRAGPSWRSSPRPARRDPVRAALTGPVATACPASILRTRSNVTLHLDAAVRRGGAWVNAPELHVVTFPNVAELGAPSPRLVVGISCCRSGSR